MNELVDDGGAGARTRQDHAEIASLRLATGTAVELMRTSYRSQTFPKHTHDFFTIGVMLRGAGMLWYRGADRRTQCGEVVVIPPGEVHTGSLAPGAAVLEYLAAHVPAEVVAGAENADDAGRVPDLDAPVIQDQAIANHLRRLEPATRVDASVTCRAAADEALTTAIGLLVARHSRRARAGAPAAASLGQPRLVHVVREVLDDCYGDNAETSLGALALRAGVTPFHLVRVFTRAVGLSPHQYLVQTRIRHATELLARGLPCSLVAATTGFADQSHLTRQFKRYLGITPASYQRCVRGG